MRTGSGRPNITCQNLGCYHAGTWRLNLRCIVSSAISSMLASATQNPFVGRGTPGPDCANRKMERRASPPAHPARHERATRLSPTSGLCARQNCPMLETVADPDGGFARRIDVADSSRGSFPSSTLDYATPDRQILAAGPVCGDARAAGSGSIGALPARTLCADAAGCADAKYAFLPPRGSRGSRTIPLRPHQQK
jgi:hypothetical protein